MILAVCVDDTMGLQFHDRRQSRDSAVIQDLLEMGQPVWVHPRSAMLFPENALVEDEDYLEKAQAGEWCFCEDTAYLDHSDKIEKIVLYRWNRVYPRDLTFAFPGTWRLAESRDFVGTSHEKITREVYIP